MNSPLKLHKKQTKQWQKQKLVHGELNNLSQHRKKLVKEEENTQNTPLRPVTRLVKDTEDRAKYHIEEKLWNGFTKFGLN